MKNTTLVKRINALINSLEPDLEKNFGIIKHARKKRVIIYFIPKSNETEKEVVEGFPNLFLAVRTFSPNNDTSRTIGPRIEIGFRDEYKYGSFLNYLSKSWIIDDTYSVVDQKVTEATFKVLSSYRGLNKYDPDNLDLGELEEKLIFGIKEFVEAFQEFSKGT